MHARSIYVSKCGMGENHMIIHIYMCIHVHIVEGFTSCHSRVIGNFGCDFNLVMAIEESITK